MFNAKASGPERVGGMNKKIIISNTIKKTYTRHTHRHNCTDKMRPDKKFDTIAQNVCVSISTVSAGTHEPNRLSQTFHSSLNVSKRGKKTKKSVSYISYVCDGENTVYTHLDK